jgi:hypothetical protein
MNAPLFPASEIIEREGGEFEAATLEKNRSKAIGS